MERAYALLVCILVQFLEHRGHVHQAQLVAEVADDGGIVEHQQLPDALTVAALAQVDGLQQVPKVQVPEGDAALAPRHQQGLWDHPQTGPAAHLLLTTETFHLLTRPRDQHLQDIR